MGRPGQERGRDRGVRVSVAAPLHQTDGDHGVRGDAGRASSESGPGGESVEIHRTLSEGLEDAELARREQVLAGHEALRDLEDPIGRHVSMGSDIGGHLCGRHTLSLRGGARGRHPRILGGPRHTRRATLQNVAGALILRVRDDIQRVRARAADVGGLWSGRCRRTRGRHPVRRLLLPYGRSRDDPVHRQREPERRLLRLMARPPRVRRRRRQQVVLPRPQWPDRGGDQHRHPRRPVPLHPASVPPGLRFRRRAARLTRRRRHLLGRRGLPSPHRPALVHRGRTADDGHLGPLDRGRPAPLPS